MTLAIAAAFRSEIGGYLRRGGFREVARSGGLRFLRSESVPRVVAVVGCLERAAAREGARAAASRFGAEMIVSAGFAAGAKPSQRSGGMLVCDRLISVEGPAFTWSRDSMPELRPDPALLNRTLAQTGADELGYATGGCVTVPQFVSNSSMKAWLGRAFDVSALDMESYWVAEAAAEARLPWLAVRSILDPVEQDVSRFVGESLRDGRFRRGFRAVRHLAAHPSDAPGLVRLASQVRKRGEELSEFLTRLTAAPTASWRDAKPS